MNTRISIRGGKSEDMNRDLCSFIGNNINRWIHEYEEWSSTPYGKAVPFKKETSWWFAQKYRFEIKCDGKTLYVRELKK